MADWRETLNSITLKIKDAYLGAEEKYYHFLDGVNEKVPVYKVIDPIDRVVPSFAVVIGLVTLLILLGFYFLLYPIFGPAPSSTIIVKLIDEDESPLSGLDINFTYLGLTYTESTDIYGEATFNAPQGTLISINVAEAGFEPVFREMTSEQETEIITILLLSTQPAALSKTISLRDYSGQPVSGALVNFACSYEGAVPPESQYTDYTGSVTVVVASNCGQLLVTASAPGFEDIQSIPVTDDYFTINFSPDEESVGTIRVNVFSNTNPVDNIRVKLYRYFEQELGPVDSDYSASGLVTFQGVYPSDYIVKTEATDLYGAAESAVFTLGAQGDETVTLDLEKKIIGSISVKITDQGTGMALSDARVTLRLRGRELAEKITDNNGIVKLFISEDTAHEVIVDHEDYLVKSVTNLTQNTSPTNIGLEKYVPGVNGGNLNVAVVDDLGNTVHNAIVGLYDADTGALMPYQEQYTDLNGIAHFERIEDGHYKAFAFKKQSSGWSEAALYDKREAQATKMTAVIEIMEGTVEVHVVDSEGVPVSFARVEVYDAYNDVMQGSDFTNEEGVFSMEVKSDKDVYIKASQEHSIFYTAAKPVLASTVQTFNVMLPARMAPEDITVEFKGMYQDGQTVTNLAPGQRYTARFWVKVTEATDYDEVGLHIRVGEAEITEKDSLFIRSTNIPLTIPERAGAFTGDYATDAPSYVYNDAKWIDAFWDHPLHAIYEAEVEIEVKPQATLDEQLVIYYKVYGKTESFVHRDPYDESPADYELYNNTKREVRQVGVPTYCDDEFCFDAQIFDKESRILSPVTGEFLGEAFGAYNLKFNLVNNSETAFHNNAFIRISNPEKNVWFTDYELSNSETGAVSGTLNGYRFNDYDVGNFTPKKIVSGDIDFLPQKAGTGVINIQLISDFQKVKEINLPIISEATNDLEVSIDPEVLPSGIENNVRFGVRDASNGVELQNATVTVLDRFAIILAQGTTDRLGKLELDLPAQNPGENLKVRVSKPNYNTQEVDFKVKSEILDFALDEIGLSLNSKTKFDDTQALQAQSVVKFPFKIHSLEAKGNFKGVLNLDEMNNYLKQFQGLVFNPNETKTLNVKAFLTEEGKSISEHQSFNGTLVIRVTNFGQLWTFELPLLIDVGLGAEVDDPTCLTLTKQSWNISSEGQPVKTEFEVQNNCIIQNTPSAIRDLGVKLEPQGNVSGDYLIEVFEDGIKKSQATVRPGYYKKILGIMDPAKRYQVNVTFTPHGGVFTNETGTLKFQAINPLEGEDQTLEAAMQYEIAVANFRECITFSKDLIILDQAPGGEADFYIETNDCGGTTTFTFDSKLETSVTEVRLGPTEKSQEITVYGAAHYQGQYPLTVNIKPEHSKTLREQKTLRVRIPPKETDCYELSRYEFDVWQDPANPQYTGYDNAELINRCYNTNVTVKISMRSFKDSLIQGAKWGVLAGFISWMGNAAGAAGAAAGGKKAAGVLDAAKKAVQLGAEIKELNDKIAAAKAKGEDTTALEKEKAEKEKQYNEVKKQAEEDKKKQEAENRSDCVKAGSECKPRSLCDNIDQGGLGQVIGVGDEVRGCDKEVAAGYVCCHKGASREAPKGCCFESSPVMVCTNDATEAQCANGEFNEGKECSEVDMCADVTTVQGAINISSATGLATATQTAASSGAASTNLFGGASSLFTQLFTKVIGTSNPWAVGAVVGVATGLYDYYSKEDEVPMTLKASEVVTSFEELAILQESGDDKAVDTVISVDAQSSSLEPNEAPKKEGLSQQVTGLRFKREEDFEGSIFKVLKVPAVKKVYDTSKTFKPDTWESAHKRAPDETDLDIAALEDMSTKMHLQFNSITPGEFIYEDLNRLDCELLGGGTGATGASALPKVKYDWDWQHIGFDECDALNPDHVYCDATQFSIASLKKVYLLKEFLEANADDLECPLTEGLSSVRKNIIGEDDIGIELLTVEKTGDNDVNVLVDVFNNNQQAPKVDLTITITEEGGASDDCKVELQPLTKVRKGCEFENLDEGRYDVEAEIKVDLSDCDYCYNPNKADDKVDSYFFIGASGLEECEPYNTERLLAFVEATPSGKIKWSGPGWNIGSKENLASILVFDSYLMLDQYSSDFQEDFDRTYRTQLFLGADQWYLDELSQYFKNYDAFRFASKHGETEATGLMVQPGVYATTLNIEFDNDQWEFFRNDLLDAIVRVELEKKSVPVPNYPFYYMPFDGIVGADNSRINYGLDFSGDIVQVNNDPSYTVETLDMPGSNPAKQLNSEFSENFKSINVWNRGRILRVSGGQAGNIDLTFSPSYATPVIMNVDNQSQEAWSFYSVAVDNSTVQSNVGPEMLLWSGIGLQCKDFQGRSVVDMYDETADIHALDTAVVEAARVAPNKEISYGLEWPGPLVKRGDVWVKTVVFTPQGMPSSMKIESASDNAGLIVPGVSAESARKTVNLFGVPGMAYNDYGGADIDSIQEVFDLVEDRKVCVSGTGLTTEFVWNPKVIYSELSSQEDYARNNCIED